MKCLNIWLSFDQFFKNFFFTVEKKTWKCEEVAKTLNKALKADSSAKMELLILNIFI